MAREQVQDRASPLLPGCPDRVEELIHSLQGGNTELQRVVRSVRLHTFGMQRIVHGGEHHPRSLMESVPVLRPPLSEGPCDVPPNPFCGLRAG